jgi:hypothetical protein
MNKQFVVGVSIFTESPKGEELRVIVKGAASFPNVEPAGKIVGKAILDALRTGTGFAGVVHGVLTAKYGDGPAFQLVNDLPDDVTCVLWADLDKPDSPELAHGAGIAGTDPYDWTHTDYGLEGMCRWFGIDPPRELIAKAAAAKAKVADKAPPVKVAATKEAPPASAKAAVDAAAAMLKAMTAPAGKEAEKAAKAPGPVTVTKPASIEATKQAAVAQAKATQAQAKADKATKPAPKAKAAKAPAKPAPKAKAEQRASA